MGRCKCKNRYKKAWTHHSGGTLYTRALTNRIAGAMETGPEEMSQQLLLRPSLWKLRGQSHDLLAL